MQKQHIAIALVASLLLAAVCAAPNAAADILLKAVGKNEISLRPKTMDSQIDIRGQIAQIKTTLTMASELDIQSEADFEYTVPDNTLVTYFAYWYKGKKVVARIVTKERAAEIYRIVSNNKVREHRRWTYSDPAIVEMTDKNTFHVRIFPIEANADLKVEIHSVQLLDSDAKGSVFTFPLKAPEKNKGTLEKIHLHLQLHPGSDVTGISNNYNLPLIRSNNIQTLDLQQQNWRAPQDLKVRFSRPVKALNANLYSARAGGANGFFALILIPSQDIPKPRLEIQGIKTWQLLPAKLAPMKAHVPVLVTGRYSGNGAAKVLLHGYGKNGVLTGTTKVLFSSQIVQPNPAAQFWAKLQMQHLATNPKNKSAVMQLSQRFNLPSKYTSWLALPEEGRKVYEKNLANSKIDELGPKLAKLIADGKGKSTSARHLREVINVQSGIIDENPDDVVADYLGQYIGNTIDEIIEAKRQKKTDANYVHKKQNHLRMLLSYIPTQSNKRIKSNIRNITKTDYRNAAKRYVELIESDQGKSPQTTALFEHMNRMYAANKDFLESTPEERIQDSAWKTTIEMTQNISKEKVKENPDLQKVASLTAKFRQFAKATFVDVKSKMEQADSTVFNTKLYAFLGAREKLRHYNKDWDYPQKIQDAKDYKSIITDRLDISKEERYKTFARLVYEVSQPLAKKYFSLKDGGFEKYYESQKVLSQIKGMAKVINVPYKDLINDEARDWAEKQVGYRNPLPNKIIDLEEADYSTDGRLLKLKGRLREVVDILNYTPKHFIQGSEEGEINYEWEYHRPQHTVSVDKYLADARFKRLAQRVVPKIYEANTVLPIEKKLKHPDEAYIKELEDLRTQALQGLPPDIQAKLKSGDGHFYQYGYGYYGAGQLGIIRNLLLREYRKDDPDEARVKELKDTLIELEKDDWYLKAKNSWQTRARNITNPTLYGNLRAQRLELRANREKVEDKIKSGSDPAQLQSLNDQRATIMAQQKKLIARMGDPLISVQAENAKSVVALMPDGQIKQLVFDAQKERWEARFDIPASAAEGQYTIQIIVVHKDGSRQMLKMHYSVDLTPPDGNAQMTVIDKEYSGQKVLRLEVQTDDNAARVSALLPWNQKVDLMPSENTSNQFFALTPVPESYGKSTFPVTFVLTDKAHNRAEITVASK